MSAPNIVNVTAITGKTAAAIAALTPTALVTNASNSGNVIKLNTVVAVNANVSNATVTVELYRSSTSYYLASGITVPAKAQLTILAKDVAIYLEEGDSIHVSASTATGISVTSSYEILG
jgi:hypothetical protein